MDLFSIIINTQAIGAGIGLLFILFNFLLFLIIFFGIDYFRADEAANDWFRTTIKDISTAVWKILTAPFRK